MEIFNWLDIHSPFTFFIQAEQYTHIHTSKHSHTRTKTIHPITCRKIDEWNFFCAIYRIPFSFYAYFFSLFFSIRFNPFIYIFFVCVITLSVTRLPFFVRNIDMFLMIARISYILSLLIFFSRLCIALQSNARLHVKHKNNNIQCDTLTQQHPRRMTCGR